MNLRTKLVLTEIIDAPRISVAILGMGVLHVGLCAAGLGGWPCPFYKVTGLPCPGCGLGRATVRLLHGDWRQALRLHAFAPFLLCALVVLAVGLVLKGSAKEKWRRAVRALEERARLSQVLLVGLVVYWLLRFVLDASQWQMVVR